MIIYDNIHGYINIDIIAKSIIDTDIFQRLRNIHQLGVLYLIFPTANHSRFEHSIGTYYLANLMITNLKKNQSELNITDDIIQLVSIAGLCHDLGHLLFSHLFDDYFLPKLPNYEELIKKTDNINHENRSIFLLKYLINKYNINLNEEQTLVICDLINPIKASYSKWISKYQIGEWIFQIISNSINSIDVDKFDYLVRDNLAVGTKWNFNPARLINDAKVINNNICYSKQCSEDIYQMFQIRYRLHRQIYNHKAVKAIEILISQLLLEIEKELKISEYILDAEKMLELIDPFIFFQNKNSIINNIWNKINTRKLPKLIFEDISLNPNNYINLEKYKNINIKIIKFSAGYVGSNLNNPLNNIYFYDIKSNKIVNTSIDIFSLFINSENYREYFTRIYDLN
jgi:HD superfamily phosphohydrolase